MTAGGINLTGYYRVAQLSQSLNRFMRQVTLAKAQINTSYKPNLSVNGIGQNIDLHA